MFHNRYFKNLQESVNLYLSGQKKLVEEQD